MPVQPSTVQLQEFRSWFNQTEHTVRATIDDMLADPIFTILGEDTSNNRSDTLATTGVDYSGYAKAKTPGGTVTKDAPVEEDQHNITYVTFVQRFNYELESILHDKYQMDDPEGNELMIRLWNAVGLFLTNAWWNFNTSTSFNVTSHDGTITYTNTTPDGVAIVSASHSGPGYSGKTNVGGTGPLSVPNLTTNVQVGNQNVQSANGYSYAYEADTIIVGTEGSLLETAAQITKSTKVPATGNNAVNVYSGGTHDVIQLKFAPRTAKGVYDTTAAKQYKWATANKRNLKRMMKYKWAMKPAIIGQSTEIDQDNLDYFRTAACRIAFMPENPWCMIQNNATTAPVSASA